MPKVYYTALNIEIISDICILTLSRIFTITTVAERSITNILSAMHDDLLLKTGFFSWS